MTYISKRQIRHSLIIGDIDTRNIKCYLFFYYFRVFNDSIILYFRYLKQTDAISFNH